MPDTPLISIGIVTHNSADDIAACIAAVRAQTYQPDIELLVGDNASTDRTWTLVTGLTISSERVRFDRNTGFSAAHNALIRRSLGAWYVALNPDVALAPTFVATAIEALAGEDRVGSVSGKLVRRDPSAVIDSTGIVMVPSIRHLDRGADEPDRGQFDRDEDVFGASGAAAVYRRAMLDDVAIEGEYFDEDFFAYREDADLAWRAQWRGWRCRYVAAAVAVHRRRVTPQRRAQLPGEINRWSVRNRFLLRIKNQSRPHFRRFLLPSLVRDLQVVGYVVLREWSSIPGLLDVVRLWRHTWRKRRHIMATRQLSEAAMAAWFESEPQARHTRAGDR